MIENDITDYRQFTAIVDEYFTAPDRVLSRVRETGIGEISE